MDFLRFCIPFFCIRWLMGHYLLSANPARNAHDFRTDTMGFQPLAQMGRSLGQMADKVSDGTFLWCDALLRNITIFYN